jgi:GcrA cell cycle regulator
MFFGWNPEREDMLKTLAAEGRSYGQIAEEIFGTKEARSAVAGKLSRNPELLSPERYEAIKRIRAEKPVPSQRPPRRFVSKTVSRDLSNVPLPNPKFNCSFMELKSNSCRNPIGEPEDPDFMFCGNPVLDSSISYCEHCAARNFREPTRQEQRLMCAR